MRFKTHKNGEVECGSCHAKERPHLTMAEAASKDKAEGKKVKTAFADAALAWRRGFEARHRNCGNVDAPTAEK